MPIACPIKRKEYARQDYLRRREKILAENKTPEKRAKNNANLRAWKARNPEKSNAQKVAYRKRRAEREGRKYRTAEQMAVEVAAAKKALVKKRMRRRLMQQWGIATKYLMLQGKSREAHYYHRKMKTDPAFLVAMRMRIGIRKQLKEYEGEIRWQEALGYTAQQLADHIESLFAPNMTWDDVRATRIHIDHIKPKSLFSYTSPHDQAFKECWAMSNLQPLWAEDNRAKRNYYEELINDCDKEPSYDMTEEE